MPVDGNDAGWIVVALLAISLVVATTPAGSSSLEDADGDGVKDAIEERLCTSPFARDLLGLEGAGSCSGPKDYVPDQSVGLLVPGEISKGPDADGDGFPASVEVAFDRVRIDRRHDVSLIEEGPSARLIFDGPPYGDDGEAERPYPAVLCRAFPVLTGISSPVDEDEDGFPAYAKIGRGQICFDRMEDRYMEGFYRSAKLDVDPDDEDPTEPSGARVDLEPVGVSREIGPDFDGDTVVSEIRHRLATLIYDRRMPADPAIERSWETAELDPDDRDAEEPRRMPAPEEDGDHDHVLDSVEPHVCLHDDPNAAWDEQCVLLSVEPTPLYQVVTAPAFAHHPT